MQQHDKVDFVFVDNLLGGGKGTHATAATVIYLLTNLGRYLVGNGIEDPFDILRPLRVMHDEHLVI